MQLTSNSTVIALLTVHLLQSGDRNVKELTTAEWAQFAAWLKGQNKEPSELLESNIEKSLAGWENEKISVGRIKSLLDRRAAIETAVERWEQAGIRTVTRADKGYPMRLKLKLKTMAPPVIFGSGNWNLLNAKGIAVVGSRDAVDEDLEYSEMLGREVAQQGLSTVSGGARGIDQSAMSGALSNNGGVVGVLAENLASKSTSKQYRDHLSSKRLLLLSTFNPEVRFSVGNAMARNRYIYCLSNASVVVCSKPNKGGSWNGAKENLRHKWVPLWVKQIENRNSGNHLLVKAGAQWLPEHLKSWLQSGEFAVELSSDRDSQSLFTFDQSPSKFSTAASGNLL